MSTSANTNARKIYRYPSKHRSECTQGCLPSKWEAGEIFRFTYRNKESSDDEPLDKDHYVLMLPEEYTTDCRINDSKYCPCLVITTHLINKRETRLSLYEQTLEPTNPKNSSGSSFKLIDIDTDTSYRPETFDRTDRAVSCVPWLWKYGSCISIQDPRMIRRNCLHLVKPDSPNFGMRLNDRQLRSVCDMLGYYGIKPHRVPEQEGTSREGLIINLLEASREINQNLLEALRDLTQQVLQVLRLVEARSQEDNRIAPLPSPSSFLKNDINHK